MICPFKEGCSSIEHSIQDTVDASVETLNTNKIEEWIDVNKVDTKTVYQIKCLLC